MDLYIVHPETREIIKARVPNFAEVVRASHEQSVILVPRGQVYNPEVNYPKLSFTQVLDVLSLEREEPGGPRSMVEAIHELGLDIETCAGGCEFGMARTIVSSPPKPRNSPPTGVTMK